MATRGHFNIVAYANRARAQPMFPDMIASPAPTNPIRSMTALSLLNPVYRRENMAPFYVVDDIFTHAEIDTITRYCQGMGTEKAPVMQSRGSLVTDDKLRLSDIRMHDINRDNRWIFERVAEAFESANRDAYNFLYIHVDPH